MTGHAKLSDDEDIEWRYERLRHFIAYGNTAARQSQHRDVATTPVACQRSCERNSGLAAIIERSKLVHVRSCPSN